MSIRKYVVWILGAPIYLLSRCFFEILLLICEVIGFGFSWCKIDERPPHLRVPKPPPPPPRRKED